MTVAVAKAQNPVVQNPHLPQEGLQESILVQQNTITQEIEPRHGRKN